MKTLYILNIILNEAALYTDNKTQMKTNASSLLFHFI